MNGLHYADAEDSFAALSLLRLDLLASKSCSCGEGPCTKLKDLALQEMALREAKVHFLDCGAPFVLPEGGLDSSILPDALHPNAGGMELLAACLKPQLDILVSYQNSPMQANAGL